MKTLITKAKSIISGGALFACGCVMAGIGLAVMSLLALFALFAVGVALLAAPFVALGRADGLNENDVVDTATAA
jgi:hypothetical protein